MSPLTVPRFEKCIQRPTSDAVVYDVRQEHIDELRFHKNFRTPLASTIQKLQQISSWQSDWDGHGAAKPNRYSVLNALQWIMRMRRHATQTRNRWVEPHVVSDTNGNIVFEWSEDERTLSVYVSPHAVEYLKVKGPHIYSDMQDGEITTSEDNQDLWRWLMERE